MAFKLQPGYNRKSLARLPKRDVPTPNGGDVAVMLATLDAHPDKKFVVGSLSSSFMGTYSAKTVRRAILNGYHDIYGWMHINQLYEEQVVTKDKRTGRLSYDKVLCDSMTTGNVSFDFDKVPGVNSIEMMYNLLKSKGLPLPSYITPTEDSNFHVLYTARYGYWTKERKTAYAFDFIGKKYKGEVSPTDIMLMKSAGLDYNYLTQDTAMCKIAFPGSVKPRTFGRKHFLCVGTYYPENDHLRAEQLKYLGENPVEIEIPEKPKKEKKLKPKNHKFYNEHLVKVQEIIAPYIPKKCAKKIALYLTQRLGFLCKDDCKISQIKLSEIVGVTQPTISRHLRALVKAGVIETRNKGYYRFTATPGEIGQPKTYGAGPALRSLLKVTDEKIIRRVLSEPYREGEANAAFLKDIGVMYKCGFPDDDIVRICSLKMEDRGANKKTDKEIRRAVERWDSRPDRVMRRPKKPLVDPDSILLIVGSSQ